MSPRRLVAVLAFCLMTGAAARVQAQSPQLVQEIALANQQASAKAYAQAIPHAQAALALAQTDPTVTPAQRIELLNLLAHLDYLEGDYAAAERSTRAALDLRRSSGDSLTAVATSEEDLAELLDLQGNFTAAAPLHADAAAGLRTVFRGSAQPSSAVGRAGSAPIRESVFDFFDAGEPEDAGYGRYTYVILSPKKDRALALLTTFFDLPAGTTVATPNRAIVNAFEIPVTTGRRTAARESSAPAAAGTAADKANRVWTLYDFAAANNLLLAACKAPDPTTTNACKDIGAGPYLVTFTHPASAFATVPRPYLIVDMSNLRSQAFAYIVKTMQNQLEARDLTAIGDAGGIHSTQTALLNVVLAAQDWLSPVSDSIPKWMQVFAAK